MEVKSQLMDTQSAKDVQGCEDMIGKHLEVLADMEVQKERWIKTYWSFLFASLTYLALLKKVSANIR